MDALVEDVTRTADDEKATRDVVAHIEAQEFDSEALKLDAAMYEEDGDCNMFRAAKCNVSVMAKLKRFIRFQRVSSQCFSTGFLFWYWPFYGTAEAEKIKQDTRYQFMEFSENSIKDTYVRPHFSAFKEELLGSKLVGIVAKGDEYAASETCKQMQSDIAPMRDFFDDPYRFEIMKDSFETAPFIRGDRVRRFL